ncbi:uncharacterized protein NPIL_137071 [Nephila pilipes]|uniref:Uncharacterized protein n=1 Tax=Nephila pilipes TaxID=299642 RepID=A0A8X6TGL5_NEPPI|nr:uncharacterized protein NPIL_137071 [Nephila pilipes]
MSVDTILYTAPWVPYNDSLFHSRLVLSYPKNMIFTAQLLSHVLSLPVYQNYPFAERFPIQSLQNVNWEQTLIVLNPDSQVVMAPEPVLALIQLDRRLQFQEAQQIIFGPFRLLPFGWFHSQWIWIISLLVGYTLMTALLTLIQRKPYRLVLSSTPSKGSPHLRA